MLLFGHRHICWQDSPPFSKTPDSEQVKRGENLEKASARTNHQACVQPLTQENGYLVVGSHV